MQHALVPGSGIHPSGSQLTDQPVLINEISYSLSYNMIAEGVQMDKVLCEVVPFIHIKSRIHIGQVEEIEILPLLALEE